MKTLLIAIACAAMALAARASAQEAPGPAASSGATGVARLSWLRGCWQSADGSTVTSEQWMAPSGGLMLGMSRTVQDSRAAWFEFTRIWEDSAGGVFFTALPSGQAAGTFPMVRANDHEVIFENPGHDYPQRIIYRMSGADSLLGRIEGVVAGKPRSSDFPMRRVPCTPPPRPVIPPNTLASVDLPPELDRVLRDYEKGWSTGDLEGLAALFAPKGMALPNGAVPARGAEEIRKAYASGAGGPLRLRAMSWDTSGDLAYIIGGYSVAAGEPDLGKFVLVLRRGAEGRWFILSDIDNLNFRP